MLRSEPAELQDAACLDLQCGPGPCGRRGQQRTARGKQRRAVTGEQRTLGIWPHRQLRHRWRSERRRIRHHDRDVQRPGAARCGATASSARRRCRACRRTARRSAARRSPPAAPPAARPIAGRIAKLKPVIASSTPARNSRQSKPIIEHVTRALVRPTAWQRRRKAAVLPDARVAEQRHEPRAVRHPGPRDHGSALARAASAQGCEADRSG